MPSWDLFEAQADDYRERCCRPACRRWRSRPARHFGWERCADDVVGIDRFGASAPGRRGARAVSASRPSTWPTSPAELLDVDRREHDDGPACITCLDEFGQSPWLDNLKRGYLTTGELARAGRRTASAGVTSNPTIFQKAIAGSADYDEQFSARSSTGSRRSTTLLGHSSSTTSTTPLDVLRPVYDGSSGGDGFVSVEVAPELAHDTDAARSRRPASLHERIDRPNLWSRSRPPPRACPRSRQMIAEGRNINVTLIFSLDRYGEVIEAYLAGLEALRGRPRPACAAWRRSSSAGSTPRSTGGSTRSARPRPRAARQGRGGPGQARVRAVPRAVLAARGGTRSRRAAPRCSGRCGRRRPRRTRPTPTRSTSTS